MAQCGGAVGRGGAQSGMWHGAVRWGGGARWGAKRGVAWCSWARGGARGGARWGAVGRGGAQSGMWHGAVRSCGGPCGHWNMLNSPMQPPDFYLTKTLLHTHATKDTAHMHSRTQRTQSTASHT
eukprot:363010-Chlamydomonas_euryale.AAC.1